MSVTTPPVITAPSKRRRIPHAPKTEAGLRTALAYPGPQPRRVTLGATIRPTAPLVIPRHVELIPSLYGFEGDGGWPILFDGPLNADRVPVFYGYKPGQVFGTFGGKDKLPEHWWSETEDEAPAINCAIQSKPREHGHTVRLAARLHLIRGDLPMAETYTALIGAGHSRTLLHCMDGWAPQKWHHADQWASHPEGNHSFVIGMGGRIGNKDCYNSVVEGIGINCYNASRTYLGTGRKISAVSSEGPVQEGSSVRYVSAAFATGCAVGFPRHNGQPSNLNTLNISSVWLHTMGRDSVPLLFTGQSNNTKACLVSIDCGIENADPEFSYPKVGVQAQGIISLDRFHIERVLHGIRIAQSEGPNNVNATNIDFNNLNGPSGVFDPDTTYGECSAGVVVDSMVETVNFEARYTGEYNLRDEMRIEGLRSCGQTCFLFRDRATGQHITSNKQGQHQNAQSGVLRHYSRRDLWTPNGWYDARNPATDRVYYTLRL